VIELAANPFSPSKALNNMTDHKIISRAKAKAAGLKNYFTGKPCLRGHIALRQTSNGCCRECAYGRMEQWAHQEENRLAIRKRNRRRAIDYYPRNRERVIAKTREYYEGNKSMVLRKQRETDTTAAIESTSGTIVPYRQNKPTVSIPARQ